MLVSALGFAMLFSYVSASLFVIQNILGLSTGAYASLSASMPWA